MKAKFKVRKLRNSKVDYFVHKIRKSIGASLIAFVFGAFVILNIASVGAQPGSNPPSGDVDAEFTTVRVGSMGGGSLNSGDLWVDDEVTAARINSNQIRVGEIFSNGSGVGGPDTITIGDNLEITDNLSVSGIISNPEEAFLIVDDTILLNGNLTMGGSSNINNFGGDIGSFYHIWKEVFMNEGNGYEVDDEKFESVSCLPGTVLVSCNGRVWDPYTSIDGEHMGTKVIGQRECRSFARMLPREGGTDPNHYVGAICFDPSGQQTSDIEQ